jgi:hypothetical protein
VTAAELQTAVDAAVADGRTLELGGITLSGGSVDLKKASVKITGTVTLEDNVAINAADAAVTFAEGAKFAGDATNFIAGSSTVFSATTVTGGVKARDSDGGCGFAGIGCFRRYCGGEEPYAGRGYNHSSKSQGGCVWDVDGARRGFPRNAHCFQWRDP